MAKKKTFEDSLAEIDDIIENLERGELPLEESIKEYEKSIKIIERCSKMLDEAEGKIKKIEEKDGDIHLVDFE